MPGEKVDGNDVEAVFRAARAAATRARKGLGPSLLEGLSYRWEGHSIFTRQEIRPTEEIKHWKKLCPIQRLRTRLLEDGIASADSLEQIESEVVAEVAKAVVSAKKSPPAETRTALQDVYSPDTP
jgi:pyruvate dehydrogenase E1 component alpha subunit